MRQENYASANEIVRNLGQITGYEILETHGFFRIVRLAPPFYDGSEIWVVNDKGFLWEPASSIEAAQAYINSDEAQDYETSRPQQN
jgi:hypothetical protein